MTTSGTQTGPFVAGAADCAALRVESALLVGWKASKQTTKVTKKATPPPSTHVRFGSSQGMLPSDLHGRGHTGLAEICGKSGGTMRSQRIVVDPIGGQTLVERHGSREHPVDRAMTRFRWLLFASLAATAHGALAAALATLPDRRGVAPTREDPSTEVASIEVEPLPAERPMEAHSAEGETTAPAARAPRLRAERQVAGTPSSTETAPGSELREPSPASSSDAEWTFDPTVGTNPLSNAVIARAVQPQVREFGEQAGRGSTAGGLAEALTARDVETGTGQGGQVLSAFEARARTMDVAVEGWAVFDVGIDTSGRVSVAVTDASTARDAWERVARTAVADVDAKRIRIPRGARGWRIAVRVEAKEQYPDGERPKDMGGHVTTTRLKESKTSMVVESLPGVQLAARGKVCSVGLNLQFPLPPMIAGGCNPENAGVREIRVVSGRIVDEGPL